MTDEPEFETTIRDHDSHVRDVGPDHIFENDKELDDPSYIGAPVVVDPKTGEVHVRPTEK